MDTLLFIYLVWLPLSTVFYATVKKDDIVNKKKKALFVALTLPSVWFFVLNETLAKLATKLPSVAKVAKWFVKK